MILADHCVFGATIRLLRGAGYQVVRLKDLGSSDLPDAEVLALAGRHDLVLLTNDSDFGDIVRYPPAGYGGIIVLKIRSQLEDQVHRVLLQVLRGRNREQFRGTLIVVSHAKYRVRM